MEGLQGVYNWHNRSLNAWGCCHSNQFTAGCVRTVGWSEADRGRHLALSLQSQPDQAPTQFISIRRECFTFYYFFNALILQPTQVAHDNSAISPKDQCVFIFSHPLPPHIPLKQPPSSTAHGRIGYRKTELLYLSSQGRPAPRKVDLLPHNSSPYSLIFTSRSPPRMKKPIIKAARDRWRGRRWRQKKTIRVSADEGEEVRPSTWRSNHSWGGWLEEDGG